MTAPIGHQQGQVLKELFVPGADNGPKNEPPALALRRCGGVALHPFRRETARLLGEICQKFGPKAIQRFG